MSERDGQDRSKGRGGRRRTRIGKALRTRTRPQQEGFLRLIQDLIDERVEDRLPTTMEITGRDRSDGRGGNVRGLLADEAEPRTVGFSRLKGTEYQQGDKVVAMPTRSGEYVVIGSITNGQGDNAEEGVGDRQVMGGAIGRRHMQPESIDDTMIVENAVRGRQIKNGEVGRDHFSDPVRNDFGRIEGKADQGIKDAKDADTKAADAKSKAQDADTAAKNADAKAVDAKNKADAAKSAADNAKGAADKANTDIAKILREIDDIKQRIKKQEDKKK